MKAVFLDRDGVINQKAPEGDYIAHWERIRYLPEVFPSLAALDRAGFKILIVTNQRGIAIGKVRPADLEEIHRRMRAEFSREGVDLAGIYVCPHDFADQCACRKPKPGLLLRAAVEHRIDLTSSWMIGDASSDIEAGKAAGCRTARILRGSAVERGDNQADFCSPDLPSAAGRILQLCQIGDQP